MHHQARHQTSKAPKRAAGSEMTLDVDRVLDGGVNGKEQLG
jgi:hypothetical protein